MASTTDATGEAGGESEATTREQPPGPDGLPLVGNTLAFLRDPVVFYERLAAYDADVVGYEIAGTQGYMLKHPSYVEQVLVHDDEKFVRGEVTAESLGSVVDGGLFLSEGADWARQRKLLQPAFYRGRLEGYADTMVESARETVAGWDDGAVVPVREEMQRLTLGVLTRTLFGVDLEGRGEAIGRAATALLARFDAGSPSAYLPAWVPTPRNRRFRRAVAEMYEVVDDLVDERDGDPDGEDLLSLLVAAREGEVDFGEGEGRLSDDDLRANLVTFLIAGHDTTSLALTYALYLLATHPAATERLRAELADVEGTVGAADLPDLPYLDRVVTETLRLYPPAYTVFREPTEPVEIGGYEVPPGTNLSMSQYVVHRDGRWYDRPLAFRPERWTEDFEAELPDYAYFPFGGGPRHCIGMRFARMEAKLALATIVPRVEFEPVDPDPIDLRMAITLQPGGPVEMRVHER